MFQPDDEANNFQVDFNEILKPMLTFMKWYGLWFIPDDVLQKKVFGFNIWKLNSILFIFLNFLTFFMYGGITVVYGPTVDFVTWAMACFVCILLFHNTYTSCIFHSHLSKGRFLSFFRQFHKLVEGEMERKRFNVFVTKITMRVFLITVVMSIVNILAWIALMYGNFYLGLETNFTPLSMVRHFTTPWVEIVFFYGTYAVIVVVPHLCIYHGFFVLNCMILRYSIERFNVFLEENINSTDSDNNESLYEERIEYFRRRNHFFIQMVNLFDELYQWITFEYIILCVGTSCLASYFMVFFCSNLLSKSIQIMWTMNCFASAAIVASGSVIVHGASRRSLKFLHSAHLRSRTAKPFLHLLCYAQRIAGSEVGITALGFLTITKEFVLNYIAAFFSYFFLLMQFSPPRDFCVSNLHNTTANTTFAANIH